MAAIDPMRERREDEAVRWFGRMQLAASSVVDHESFERWCAEHPGNREAYERTRDIWRDFQDLTALPEAQSLLEETARVAAASHVKPPARYLIPAALAAGALIAAILAFWYFRAPTRYSTEVAEIRALSLPDGSRVTLGALSRVKLEFNEVERRLRLEGGEAFFEVRKDPARPFIVDAGDARVRVLGTQFDVRRGADQVNIAVLEGAVEVTSSRSSQTGVEQSSSKKYLLRAGEQLTAGKVAGRVRARPNSAAAPPGAWRNGRLFYDGARLEEVLADVNRYYPAGIALASEDLADLKVTTAFNVGQIDLMIDSLTQALPVTARHEADGHVVLEARPEAK